MTTLTQTLTLTYPQDAQLDLNKKVWFVHWINDQRGRVGNVIWNCSGGISRGRKMLEDLGDVRGKCSDTVPEWHMRNLVTLEGTMTKAFTNNCSTRLIHSLVIRLLRLINIIDRIT